MENLNNCNSTQIRPYVYICIHKITKEFYIGYRERNVKLSLTSDQDFPLYKTSSKEIKEDFDKFEWYILAEFNLGDDAYDFEQKLIYENWENPLLLNRNCRYSSKKRFKDGMLGKTHNNKTKEIFRINRQGKTYEEIYGIARVDEIKKKISLANKNKIMSTDSVEKIKIARANQVITAETRAKISATVREKVNCPYCNVTGSYRIMKRWHFDNCKYKNEKIN